MLRAQIASSPINRSNSSLRNLEDNELASTSVVSNKSLILSEERRVINELSNKQLKKEVRSTKLVLQNIVSDLLAANEKISNKEKQLNKYRDAFKRGSYFMKTEVVSYEIEEYKRIVRLQEEQIEEQTHHIRYLEDLLSGLSKQVSQVYQKVLRCIDADWDVTATSAILEPFQESLGPVSPIQQTRTGKNTPNGNKQELSPSQSTKFEKLWKALILSRQENMETKEIMEQLVEASKKVSQRALVAEERVVVLEQQLKEAYVRLENSQQERASMAEKLQTTALSHKQRIEELEQERLFSQTHNEKKELARAKEQLHYLELDNQHLQQEVQKSQQQHIQSSKRIHLLEQHLILLQKDLQMKEMLLESSEHKLAALKELSAESISLGPIPEAQNPSKQPEPEEAKPVPVPQSQKTSPKATPVTFKVEYVPQSFSPAPILKRADSGSISRKEVSFGEPKVSFGQAEVKEIRNLQDSGESQEEYQEQDEVEVDDEPEETEEPQEENFEEEQVEEVEEAMEEEVVIEEGEDDEEEQDELGEGLDVEALEIPIEGSDDLQDAQSPPVTSP